MIYKYLLEIKYRLLFSFITWLSLILSCYYFKETLLYIFIKPSLHFNTNNMFYFLTTNITEIFMSYLQIIYFVSNQIIIIFIYYQIFIFISAGLYTFEYNYIKTLLIIFINCWVIFFYFLNTYIFPASWNFFLEFQNFSHTQNLTFFFETKLSEYINFYVSLAYLCNIIYQLIITFFIFLDLIKTNLLIIKQFRRIFYFLFFLTATVISPPEIIFQLTIGINIIIVYELIILSNIIKNNIVNFKSVTN